MTKEVQGCVKQQNDCQSPCRWIDPYINNNSKLKVKKKKKIIVKGGSGCNPAEYQFACVLLIKLYVKVHNPTATSRNRQADSRGTRTASLDRILYRALSDVIIVAYT